MRPYAPFAFAALVLGCSVDATGPRALSVQPRFSVDAAAPGLPNVVRFRNQFVFLVTDVEKDLFVIAGLPDNPKGVIECGGTEVLHFGVADIQWVGTWPEEAVKALAKGSDFNIDLYRNSTFTGVCESDPIAHGIGKVRHNENDAFRTSGHPDTYQDWIAGPVTFVDGSTANLLAHAVVQVVDGVFEHIVSKINLSAR